MAREVLARDQRLNGAGPHIGAHRIGIHGAHHGHQASHPRHGIVTHQVGGAHPSPRLQDAGELAKHQPRRQLVQYLVGEHHVELARLEGQGLGARHHILQLGEIRPRVEVVVIVDDAPHMLSAAGQLAGQPRSGAKCEHMAVGALADQPFQRSVGESRGTGRHVPIL